MIIFDIIKQQFKKDIRTQGFYKNLAVNIILGIFALYMAAVLLVLGFSLDDILESAHDTLNPTQLFNGAFAYIILGGLSLRIMMQQLNTINLPPYQILPLRRRTLVNFLLIKPLFNPINYISLLVVIPFAFQSTAKYYGSFAALRFIIIFIFFIWFDSLFASYLKRKFTSGFLSFIILIAIIASIALLEYFKVFSLFTLSTKVFGYVVLKNYGLVLPLLMAAGAYLFNVWFFSQNFYAERFNKKTKQTAVGTEGLGFLNKFGVIGDIIALEIKLILRHKRTKSILYMSGVFFLYGLLFYTNDIYKNNYGFLFFIAVFMTGLLMLMYGQWIIGWNSSHFDALMTKKIPVRSYFDANYFMLLAFNVLCYVITTPYFYFGTKIIYLHSAAFLFNSGVNIYLLLFFASYNAKRIDLSKSSAFNYQGTTFKNFLIVMPIMFLPMILIGIITLISSLAVALWSISILGVIGIIFRQQLISLCVNQFNKRKYKLTEGFREVE